MIILKSFPKRFLGSKSLNVTFAKIWPHKVVLFAEIGWAKTFLSLTRPHSRVCIRIYIFNFKKANKQAKKTNKKTKKTRKQKKQKKTKEENIMFSENRLKNKLAAAWVKIFLFTRISGNKSIFLVWPMITSENEVLDTIEEFF